MHIVNEHVEICCFWMARVCTIARLRKHDRRVEYTYDQWNAKTHQYMTVTNENFTIPRQKVSSHSLSLSVAIMTRVSETKDRHIATRQYLEASYSAATFRCPYEWQTYIILHLWPGKQAMSVTPRIIGLFLCEMDAPLVVPSPLQFDGTLLS